tara:strand:+ start:180 stop:593 length:414 start_codon:yes stop_codon:yes gene_type:complete
MSDQLDHGKEEIHSKVLRAGRRTYFFDVRATKADDYYLTITESKKHTNEGGNSFYKKHKIYLYKEDFERFRDILDDVTNFIVSEKGSEVISDTHQPDYYVNNPSNSENNNSQETVSEVKETVSENGNSFTDIQFEDI